MNNINAHAVRHFTLGISIFGVSFLHDVLNPIPLRVLGIVFLLSSLLLVIYSKFSYKWLTKPVEFLSRIPLTYLVIFFSLFSFYKLLESVELRFQGVLVAYVAFLVLGLALTRYFGHDVLRPVFNRLNIFMPSTEIPKEYKDKGWGL
jgi:uncharacterized BrkB/YihY/UPF0761 family membrane protein